MSAQSTVTPTSVAGVTGRVAVVTGGAAGIGRAIVDRLASAGAAVVVADRDADSLSAVTDAAAERGWTVAGYQHDVTDATATAELVADVIDRFGALDILVNNAGVSRAASFLDIDEREWDRVNDINCKAVFFTSRAVAPHMMQRRSGRIVNISSIAGKETTPLFTHYSAAKFGVMAITQGLAKELGPYGVTVNAVCPGIVRTPLWDPLLHQLADRHRTSEEAAFDGFVAQIPLQRPQEPADIAAAVAFLASDDARNITGQGLNVCGGMQLH